ncbi:MAG: zinc transporter ZupT [archaeon]
MVATSTILIAFGLTLFAGLATGIGSAIAFFCKRTNKKFLSISLGFSAGVMIYVSFTELFVQANRGLMASLGDSAGSWVAVISFFGGMLVAAFIDKLVPHYENPHEPHRVEEMNDTEEAKRFRKLHRVGILTAVAIAVHNFPEGMVTFIGTLSDVKLGIALAVAIAIHNIPEGIAVSVPFFYGTGDRKKAFLYSFLSGLAEPVGALIGFLILMPFMNDAVSGILYAAVAGIMVFISFDELLPTAREYGEHHLVVYGLVVGMIIMAVSLLLLFV